MDHLKKFLRNFGNSRSKKYSDLYSNELLSFIFSFSIFCRPCLSLVRIGAKIGINQINFISIYPEATESSRCGHSQAESKRIPVHCDPEGVFDQRYKSRDASALIIRTSQYQIWGDPLFRCLFRLRL